MSETQLFQIVALLDLEDCFKLHLSYIKFITIIIIIHSLTE